MIPLRAPYIRCGEGCSNAGGSCRERTAVTIKEAKHFGLVTRLDPSALTSAISKLYNGQSPESHESDHLSLRQESSRPQGPVRDTNLTAEKDGYRSFNPFHYLLKRVRRAKLDDR